MAQRIAALSLYGSRWALSEDSGFKSYPIRQRFTWSKTWCDRQHEGSNYWGYGYKTQHISRSEVAVNHLKKARGEIWPKLKEETRWGQKVRNKKINSHNERVLSKVSLPLDCLVSSRTFVGRCNRCILQPKPTGQLRFVNVYVCMYVDWQIDNVCVHRVLYWTFNFIHYANGKYFLFCDKSCRIKISKKKQKKKTTYIKWSYKQRLF